MIEAAILFSIAYMVCGGVVLCHELLDDSKAADIRRAGWPLIAVVVVGWPVFVWEALRNEL